MSWTEEDERQAQAISKKNALKQAALMSMLMMMERGMSSDPKEKRPVHHQEKYKHPNKRCKEESKTRRRMAKMSRRKNRK